MNEKRYCPHSRISLVLTCCLWFFASAIAFAQETLQIDADIPGGNIIVDKIDGDTVSLHQDLRDTPGHWFYWQFRVQGAQGRTLRFQFTKGNVIGVLGPAMSLDGGETWSWLGKDSVNNTSFQFSFPSDANDVRFCVSIPYLEKDLRKFLIRYASNTALELGTLCETKKGRKVERLGIGKGRVKILLTARHHACEMIASYVLEGILEEAMSDTESGKWYRHNAEILAIPFMDKDGVEDNVPYGTAWNNASNFTRGMNFGGWAQTLPGNPAATTLEVSYANANGTIVTADSARALGRDLARAIHTFLE